MMEKTGLHGRQSKIARVGILLLIMGMIIPAFTDEKTCPEGDYLTNGICCNKCFPGYKLVESCRVQGQRSNCTLCAAGEYNEQMNNYRNCRQCRTCKESSHELEESPCTAKSNTICRCMDGYYKVKMDSVKYECRRCKTKCPTDEILIEKCTPNKNTVCGCKENYVKVNGKCEPCKNCTSECQVKCATTHMTTQSEYLPVITMKKKKNEQTAFWINSYSPPHQLLMNVLCGAGAGFLVLLVLVAFITFKSTKIHVKKKIQSQSSQPSDVSFESSKEVLINMEPSQNVMAKSIPQISLCEQELSNLPDCVPLEIKIPDIIYMVLDLVPVLQVKQLVRSLGVRDTEIEQAVVDYQSCREAHYQMLRMWAEKGSRAVGGGRGGMLHRPLLEELLDKLRQMHLGRAAEELETKYGIQ